VRKWWKDYFTFNKTERIGLFVLVGLIGLVWLLPQYFNKTSIKSNSVKIKGVDLDTLNYLSIENNQHYKENSLQKHKLFFFDPNTIDDSSWMKLGLQLKTINTINHYKEKGGRFHKPDDIKKIYGIKPLLAEELLPFVRIVGSNHIEMQMGERFPPNHNFQNTKDSVYFKIRNTTSSRKLIKVDINAADTSEFIALPCIGPTLAQRIVKFRENLGGFISVEQLLEVYGIKDSVFQILKPQLICSNAIQFIAINKADFNAINRHPYISYQEAKAIVKYREQHGLFKTPEDLLNLANLDEAWLQKILPYLNFETDLNQ
jgi:competence ComEA-like helix-hairpin-helix protein